MKLIRLFTFLAFALLSGTALSATAGALPDGMTAVPLATITNDRDDTVSRINLMVNDNAVVRGIYMETRTTSHGQTSKISGQVYWLNGIESSDGVVLGSGQGVDAIFLRGNIESQPGRGALVIRYLTNGIFWSYNQCRVDLRRVDRYDWKLVNAYNHEPVRHIKVETWALGISTLRNVCPANTA